MRRPHILYGPSPQQHNSTTAQPSLAFIIHIRVIPVTLATSVSRCRQVHFSFFAPFCSGKYKEQHTCARAMPLPYINVSIHRGSPLISSRPYGTDGCKRHQLVEGAHTDTTTKCALVVYNNGGPVLISYIRSRRLADIQQNLEGRLLPFGIRFLCVSRSVLNTARWSPINTMISLYVWFLVFYIGKHDVYEMEDDVDKCNDT